MSYALTIHAHRDQRIVIETNHDLSIYNLTFFIGDRVENMQLVDIGTIDYLGGNIIIQLSADDVDEIRDSYFKIVGSKKVPTLDPYFTRRNVIDIATGYFEYIDNAEVSSDLVDSTGHIKDSLLPGSVLTVTNIDSNVLDLVTDDSTLTKQELDSTYIPRDEYVPGAGPSMESLHEIINQDLEVHVVSQTPHPAYDDLPSLKILFENGLI